MCTSLYEWVDPCERRKKTPHRIAKTVAIINKLPFYPKRVERRSVVYEPIHSHTYHAKFRFNRIWPQNEILMVFKDLIAPWHSERNVCLIYDIFLVKDKWNHSLLYGAIQPHNQNAVMCAAIECMYSLAMCIMCLSCVCVWCVCGVGVWRVIWAQLIHPASTSSIAIYLFDVIHRDVCNA